MCRLRASWAPQPCPLALACLRQLGLMPSLRHALDTTRRLSLVLTKVSTFLDAPCHLPYTSPYSQPGLQQHHWELARNAAPRQPWPTASDPKGAQETHALPLRSYDPHLTLRITCISDKLSGDLIEAGEDPHPQRSRCSPLLLQTVKVSPFAQHHGAHR